MASAMYEALQVKRALMVRRVGELDADRRRIRPHVDLWSPLETLEHLHLEDGLILHDAHRDAGPPTSSLLLKVVTKASRQSLRIPVTLPSLEPRGRMAFDEIVGEGDVLHHRLGELVAESQPGETIACHTSFGRLSAGQVCDLLDSHYAYHLRRLRLPA